MRKLSNLHPFFFYGFSIKILLGTHILPMTQLQAKQLMTSQSWPFIEYLIQLIVLCYFFCAHFWQKFILFDEFK